MRFPRLPARPLAVALLLLLGGLPRPAAGAAAVYPMVCLSCNTDGSYTCAPGCARPIWCC